MVFNLIPKAETMSSLEIAKLTGKKVAHIHRDIKNMVCELYNLERDDPYLDHKLKQYVEVYFDNRGYIKVIYLNEELTLTLTSGYSILQRNAIIKKWQAHRRGEVVTQSTALTIPQTLSDALRLAANLAEEKEHLPQ